MGELHPTAKELIRAYLDWLSVESTSAARTYSPYLDLFLEHVAKQDKAKAAADPESLSNSANPASPEAVFTRANVASFQSYVGRRRARSSPQKGQVVSDSYRHMAATALRGVLRYARAKTDHGTLADPLVVDKVKISDRVVRRMHETDLAKIRKAMGRGASEMELRDKALLEVLWSTGGRVSEISQLVFAQMDLDRGTIMVLGKGGKERPTRLTPEALKALRAYLDKRMASGKGKKRYADDWVFRSTLSLRPVRDPETGVVTRQRGNWPLSRRQIETLVGRWGKAAGLTISPHFFRHGRLSQLLRSGLNTLEVRDYAGHVSVASTEVYAKVVQSELLDKVEALDRRNKAGGRAGRKRTG